MSFQEKVVKAGKYSKHWKEIHAEDCINYDSRCICTGKQEFRYYEMINFESDEWNYPSKDATWYRKGDVCSMCLLDIWSDIACGAAVFEIKNGKEIKFIKNLSYCVGYWENEDIHIKVLEWIDHVQIKNIDLEKYKKSYTCNQIFN